MTTSDFECPTCGAEVSPNAAGCRNCGAEKVDGRWAEPAAYDGLELPDDDDFDYDDFVGREFGNGAKTRQGINLFWWIISVIVLIAFSLIALRLS